MFNFLVSFAWQVGLFWAATQIGFSMQVIDKATVLIDKPSVCSFFEQPAENGHCRVTGRLEGTLRSTWTVEQSDRPIKFELMDQSTAMIYHPKDWHMSGGPPAVVALGALWIGLSGAGIWFSYLVTRRKLRKAAMTSSASGA